MYELFPYSNILAGVLVLIVGFGIHWLNQLSLFLNWELMPRHGFGINLADSPEGYDRLIAISDMVIGWLYGIIGIGLFMGTEWGLTLAWLPGIILTLEGISYWIVTGKKHPRGKKYPYFTRIEWSALNLITGLYIIAVAWNAL